MAILIVQAITSIAVIWYFHVKKAAPGNVLTTGIIPALGGLGMLYVVWLLLDNIDFAGGVGVDRTVLQGDPLPGRRDVPRRAGRRLLAEVRNRAVYDAIGRTVFEEAHERETVPAHSRSATLTGC